MVRGVVKSSTQARTCTAELLREWIRGRIMAQPVYLGSGSQVERSDPAREAVNHRSPRMYIRPTQGVDPR